MSRPPLHRPPFPVAFAIVYPMGSDNRTLLDILPPKTDRDGKEKLRTLIESISI